MNNLFSKKKLENLSLVLNIASVVLSVITVILLTTSEYEVEIEDESIILFLNKTI